MIVYLEKGAFGASKTTKDGYICQEFPIGNDVEAALMAAIAWEKQTRHSTKEPPRVPARRTRMVFPPQFKQMKNRDCVVVSYIDKNGRRGQASQVLPEYGTEADMEETVKAVTRRAHVMAGRILSHSPA